MVWAYEPLGRVALRTMIQSALRLEARVTLTAMLGAGQAACCEFERRRQPRRLPLKSLPVPCRNFGDMRLRSKGTGNPKADAFRCVRRYGSMLSAPLNSVYYSILLSSCRSAGLAGWEK
jgi:hypothetical protein